MPLKGLRGFPRTLIQLGRDEFLSHRPVRRRFATAGGDLCPLCTAFAAVHSWLECVRAILCATIVCCSGSTVGTSICRAEIDTSFLLLRCIHESVPSSHTYVHTFKASIRYPFLPSTEVSVRNCPATGKFQQAFRRG